MAASVFLKCEVAKKTFYILSPSSRNANSGVGIIATECCGKFSTPLQLCPSGLFTILSNSSLGGLHDVAEIQILGLKDLGSNLSSATSYLCGIKQVT